MTVVTEVDRLEALLRWRRVLAFRLRVRVGRSFNSGALGPFEVDCFFNALGNRVIFGDARRLRLVHVQDRQLLPLQEKEILFTDDLLAEIPRIILVLRFGVSSTRIRRSLLDGWNPLRLVLSLLHKRIVYLILFVHVRLFGHRGQLFAAGFLPGNNAALEV